MIKRFLFILVVFYSTVTISQRNNVSPYSVFGIGEQFTSQTAEQAAMGSIGAAFISNRYLNFINPAANANLRFTTYALAGEMTELTLNTASGKETANNINLQYIALGFPIGKKAGFSAGLQPQSTVGYAFLNEIEDSEGNIIEVNRYTGSGGSNRLFAGFGYQIFKGFSVGAEAAFIFGNIDNQILNLRSNVALATKNIEETSVRGMQYKVGVQYQKELKNNLQLNAGAVFNLENTINTNTNQQLYSLSFTSAGLEIPREFIVDTSFKGNFKSPLKTTLGVGIGKDNKWYAGVNYEFQDALEDNTNTALREGYQYKNSNKFTIGGFYIPKINSISSYWDRVTYRAGVRFGNTGLAINGDTADSNNFTAINDFGINVGLGIPLGRRTASNIGLSTLNFGLEYGQRGTTNNGLIKENYFKFRISLSLNSLWFKKRKID